MHSRGARVGIVAAMCLGALAAAPAAASVIGTFSSARPGIDYRGDLFGAERGRAGLGHVDGPYGVASVVPASHMATLEIGTSSGRVILDYQDKVSLYAMNPETGWAGLGTVVFLGDVNHFEDILGWTSHAPILWRNMMTMPSVPFCYVDCDSDGEVTLFDFLCFQNRFASGDPSADCDVDGALTFFDFLCYQDAFAAGCG